MKGCPDCEREQQRLYDMQAADIAWYQRTIDVEKEDLLKRQQEALKKMQQAIDYHNMRKSMSFMQKLREVFK